MPKFKVGDTVKPSNRWSALGNAFEFHGAEVIGVTDHSVGLLSGSGRIMYVLPTEIEPHTPYISTHNSTLQYDEDLGDEWLEHITSYPEKASDKQVGGNHYKDMPIQPGEFIRANGLGWYEANAVKYICRHKQKAGRQDIEKAIHYLELVLEEYDNEQET